MKKGYLYILITTIFFSTMEIMLKITAGGFHPLQITVLRFSIGALVLLPFALRHLKRKNCRLNSGDLLYLAFTGFCCVVISMVLYQMAVIYSDASIVAILFSCNPVFVMILAALILKEKVYKYSIVSILVSLTGMMVTIDPFHAKGSATGTILSVLAAITFALYSVMGKKHGARYGSVVTTCFSFIFGAVELFILVLLTKTAWFGGFLTNVGLGVFSNTPIFAGITPDLLPNLLYIGVGVTGLGFAFYFMAMEETSAITASLVFFIKPALAPVLAFLILQEPLTSTKIAGIVLILIGSMITFIPGWKRQKAAAGLAAVSKDTVTEEIVSEEAAEEVISKSI
ncbi:DMT family transporter [Faecalispora anaeroviscerum]|uniref:DMT family transporter n=1 Tax=Faecalispora anaeroviscerum TaxID=2991836 RepID=UPI0024B8A98F|nr:DMT family transporter [Faecalispora anaeroviscerum]